MIHGSHHGDFMTLGMEAIMVIILIGDGTIMVVVVLMYIAEVEIIDIT